MPYPFRFDFLLQKLQACRSYVFVEIRATWARVFLCDLKPFRITMMNLSVVYLYTRFFIRTVEADQLNIILIKHNSFNKFLNLFYGPRLIVRIPVCKLYHSAHLDF